MNDIEGCFVETKCQDPFFMNFKGYYKLFLKYMELYSILDHEI